MLYILFKSQKEKEDTTTKVWGKRIIVEAVWLILTFIIKDYCYIQK